MTHPPSDAPSDAPSDDRAAVLRWLGDLTGACDAAWVDDVQSLWRGYGVIARVQLTGASVDSVIVKVVTPPAEQGFAHRRKLRSYQVEARWYRDWGHRCPPTLRIPGYLGDTLEDGRLLLALEDLDAAGYPERRRHLSKQALAHCLTWLARFHAHFLGATPEGLWETGSYWHLATRPEELAATVDPALKAAAAAIDARLSAARYQTLVHGDPKAANFCFSKTGALAAVDFQYVGGGCGVKDVACLLSYRGAREEAMNRHLTVYFDALREALAARDDVDPDAVVAEWRALFPTAWADYHRFLAGWAPTHWKLTVGYSRALTRAALSQLTP